MLTRADIERFIEEGFVAVRGAFPRAVADSCVDLLWPQLGVDRHDPSTWTSPVIRLPGSAEPPFGAAANTPLLHEAFDQLVGQGRWRRRFHVGTFPVRFPSESDPGDAGWHVDASYEVDGDYWLNLRSRGRALLMLFLFTDVGPDDAPTRIRVGSHLDLPPLLAPAGDRGLSWLDAAAQVVPRSEHRPVVHATGEAGDVYLCHPFLVHAASWPHRGTGPRFLAQPPLDPTGLLDVEAGTSPVEIAVQRGLAAAASR